MHKMANELGDLEAEVQQNSNAIDSAVTLIEGLADKIAQAGTDPARLQAITAELRTKRDALAQAIVTGTAAEGGGGTQPQPQPTDPNAGGTVGTDPNAGGGGAVVDQGGAGGTDPAAGGVPTTADDTGNVSTDPNAPGGAGNADPNIGGGVQPGASATDPNLNVDPNADPNSPQVMARRSPMPPRR
jgi:hypothetical protein